MWSDGLERLKNMREQRNLGGGAQRQEKHRKEGKMTARERMETLFDDGQFEEIQTFVQGRIDAFGLAEKRALGDGVIAGYGLVNGRLVFAFSEDFTVIGGTLGEYHGLKICKLQDMAIEMRAPLVCINDSAGARIEEGVSALSGYAGMFLRNTRASGVIPQIAVIMGPCAGGACYSPAICDFIFMVRGTSNMFITGPAVVKNVTGQEITADELGSADIQSTVSGVAHFVYEDDAQTMQGVRRLLSYLPQNNRDHPPADVGGIPVDRSEQLTSLVPDSRQKTYDVRSVIDTMVDRNSFFEVAEGFAQNAVVGFARIDGEVVALVANQPRHMGGSLDYHAADKIARFIRFCDCFGIPIVTLIDVPAFLPGREQEHAGIIRHGAKILYAFSEATVPKVSLIMRKAYGGAYIAMNSKNMGADVVFAWPIAEIAVMGAEGAVDVIFRRQIKASAEPEVERKRLISELEDQFMTPYTAATRGFVDEVILPEETRSKIAAALEMLRTKAQEAPWKKHGNIPL